MLVLALFRDLRRAVLLDPKPCGLLAGAALAVVLLCASHRWETSDRRTWEPARATASPFLHLDAWPLRLAQHWSNVIPINRSLS